jgi:hypothetical protein
MMSQVLAAWSHRCAAQLFAAGVLSRGYAPASTEGGFGEFLLTVLVGGFLGLVFGLMVSQTLRYVAFVTGRHLGSGVWVIAGAVLGMISFAVIAITGNDN